MSDPASVNHERAAALAAAKRKLDGLIGLPGVKEEVNRLMSFLNIQQERRRHGLRTSSQSLHFVFTGNPGTGKTTVARILANIFFGFGILKTPKVVECDRSRLVGGYLGQTAIKTNEVIQSALDGVLFIDEAYTVTGDPSRHGHGDMYGEEAVNTLLKQMEDLRDRLNLIAAGYPGPMATFLRSNPGLESRFTRFIRFEDYSVPDLCRIFQLFCRNAEYSVTPKACAKLFLLFAVAHQRKDERFGNARFVRNVYESAVSMQAARLAATGGNLRKLVLETIDGEDVPFGTLAEIDLSTVDFQDSRWEGVCPGCRKAFTGRLRLLGQRVTCSCGQRFIYPWWNLVPQSMGALPVVINFRSRPEDKLGTVDSVATAPDTPSINRDPSPLDGSVRADQDFAQYRRAMCERSPEHATSCLEALARKHLAAWKAAAERGHAPAQFLVGRMHSLGIGMPADPTTAATWYRAAAEQGFEQAQYYLGLMYEDGHGVQQDEAEAAKWYRKAAEQGDAAVQCILARMYNKGQGVPQNDSEAARWYRLAAEQGDASAQWSLATMYQDGRGVPRSDTEAVVWFRKAADQGDEYAQDSLGDMYFKGRGVAQSDTEAIAWFRKAAEQGFHWAQYHLGALFKMGRGVPASDSEAARWFLKAAEQGNLDAQESLGTMHRNGRGVEQSDDKAARYYRMAAEKGHRRAQYSLGLMYKEGRGQPQSNKEAAIWFRKAAEQGDDCAQCQLGSRYEYGHGVGKNATKAAYWYRKAAEQGYDLAQYCLGSLYLDGRGVAKSSAEAAAWFHKAAEQGLDMAQCELGALRGTANLKFRTTAVSW
jgi:TPR repeat protein